MTDSRFTPTMRFEPRPGAFPEVNDRIGAVLLREILEAGCEALGFPDDVCARFDDRQVNVEFDDDYRELDYVWINVGGHFYPANGVVRVRRDLFEKLAHRERPTTDSEDFVEFVDEIETEYRFKLNLVGKIMFQLAREHGEGGSVDFEVMIPRRAAAMGYIIEREDVKDLVCEVVRRLGGPELR